MVNCYSCLMRGQQLSGFKKAFEKNFKKVVDKAKEI